MGIEPTSKAWEAFVLPLNYTRLLAHYIRDENIIGAVFACLPRKMQA